MVLQLTSQHLQLERKERPCFTLTLSRKGHRVQADSEGVKNDWNSFFVFGRADFFLYTRSRRF